MPPSWGPHGPQRIGHLGHRATRAPGSPARDSGTAFQVCPPGTHPRAPCTGVPCTPGQAGSWWLHCPASPSSSYCHVSPSHLRDRPTRTTAPNRRDCFRSSHRQTPLPGAPGPMGLCFCLGHDPLASGCCPCFSSVATNSLACACLSAVSSCRLDFPRALPLGIGSQAGNIVAALHRGWPALLQLLLEVMQLRKETFPLAASETFPFVLGFRPSDRNVPGYGFAVVDVGVLFWFPFCTGLLKLLKTLD